MAINLPFGSMRHPNLMSRLCQRCHRASRACFKAGARCSTAAAHAVQGEDGCSQQRQGGTSVPTGITMPKKEVCTQHTLRKINHYGGSFTTNTT